MVRRTGNAPVVTELIDAGLVEVVAGHQLRGEVGGAVDVAAKIRNVIML